MLTIRIGSLVAAIALAICTVTIPAGAGNRPLSDFLSAQGSTSSFHPPVPDFIGWIDNPPVTFGAPDYAGLVARWLRDNGGPDLGTVVRGSVSERALPDGRAEVTVDLQTSNALTIAWSFATLVANGFDFVATPLIFGYRVPEILANPGLTPALSNCASHFVFINTAPGAPLPDLPLALFGGAAPPGFELKQISFRSSGQGPLRAAFGVPEGTRGQCTITQTGLFQTPFQGAVADGFPAERVDVRPIR